MAQTTGLGRRERHFSITETGKFIAKWRKFGPFLTKPEMADGDRTGWLGRQDSNLGMAESKSRPFAIRINGHSEKRSQIRA